MKALKIFFISILLVGQIAGAQISPQNSRHTRQIEPVIRVFEFRDATKGLHPFLKATLKKNSVLDSDFMVFITQDRYFFSDESKVAVDTPPPEGIVVAVPLRFFRQDAAMVAKAKVYGILWSRLWLIEDKLSYIGKNTETARFINLHIMNTPQAGDISADYGFEPDEITTQRNLWSQYLHAMAKQDFESASLYGRAMYQTLGVRGLAKLIKLEISFGLRRILYDILQKAASGRLIILSAQNGALFFSQPVATMNFTSGGISESPLLLSDPQFLLAFNCLTCSF